MTTSNISPIPFGARDVLYCDMTVDSKLTWVGVPCLNGVDLNSATYQGFVGSLMFYDTIGYSDPTYDGLGTRYSLIYWSDPDDAATMQLVPLQAVPNQQFNVILNNQNCTLSIYLREED